ncbi:MAG: cohesin domain-containing protein [Bacteroidota bacterium]
MAIKNLLFSILFIAFAGIVPNELNAQNPLILGAYNKKASPEKTVCMQIYGRQFRQILSMQYTLKWDTNLLKFKSVEEFALPGLSMENFGTRQIEEGLLTFAWFDPQLGGISKADGTVLYEVCFEVVGKSGVQTYLEFIGEPTLIEVSAAPGVLIDLKTEGSKLEIK